MREVSTASPPGVGYSGVSYYRFLFGIVLISFLRAVAYGNSQTIVLPPVNLTASETAALRIMSAAAAYPGWSFVTPCQASVNFYGPDGSSLGVSGAFTVGNTSQVFVIELPYASTGAQTPSTVVSAKIGLSTAPFNSSTLSPPIPTCALVFSFETYDSATGIGHALLVGQSGQGTEDIAILGLVSPLPCLNPEINCESMYANELTPTQVTVLPPLGLAATETAQVDIISSAASYGGTSAATCDGVVTFFGPDGASIGKNVSFTLGKTGEIFSIGLPFGSTGSTMPRETVSARIALTPPTAAIAPCVTGFSVKTVDTATGVTHVYVIGQTIPSSAGVGAAAPVPLRRRPLDR